MITVITGPYAVDLVNLEYVTICILMTHISLSMRTYDKPKWLRKVEGNLQINDKRIKTN